MQAAAMTIIKKATKQPARYFVGGQMPTLTSILLSHLTITALSRLLSSKCN